MLLILRGGIIMSIRDSPDIVSQQILVRYLIREIGPRGMALSFWLQKAYPLLSALPVPFVVAERFKDPFPQPSLSYL